LFVLGDFTVTHNTSTLYALLKRVNTEDVNIITAEDPIEIELPGAKQIQVKDEIKLDFARILRASLRSDPDIIMVGEIRDPETAQIALQASLTGHLVLSTIHTNDSIRAITRLSDMDIELAHLADSLILLQAQRLIRLLCFCKEPYDPSPEEWTRHRDMILKYSPQMPLPNDNAKEVFEAFAQRQNPVHIPKGCWHCADTGYSGRKAIMEMCVITSEMREMIVRHAPYHELLAAAQRGGFRSYFEEGLKQYLIGETSYQEVDIYRPVDTLIKS
jgi:type II secretory ATPase GspE/PulE/Tfp pilus assembly ATPase PilB-like protein